MTMDKSNLLGKEDMAEIGQGADDCREHRLVVEWDNGKIEDLEEVGEVSYTNSVSIRMGHDNHPMTSFKQAL